MVIIYLIGFLMLLILYRFFDLQILEYGKYWDKANSNAIRKITINAQRGIIFDRNGRTLVDNSPIYDLKVIPIDVSDAFNYSRLSQAIDIPVEDVRDKIRAGKKGLSRFRPLLIKRHVDFEIMARLEEFRLELPGLIFTQLPARVYPDSARLTHALGYLRTITEEIIAESDTSLNYDPDDIFGAQGLEKIYEPTLRGTDGVEFHVVDILGRDLGEHPQSGYFPPVPGEDLHLTIDSGLQILGEKLMSGWRGSLIASDAETGEILAFVSSPDYPLDSFVGPIPYELWNRWNTDEDRPLVNRCINGNYPPGSVLKLVAIASALESNTVSTGWTINCPGTYTLGNRTYHCWNEDGHGTVNMKSAIKYSCNIYFYQLIQKMPFEQWWTTTEDFGYGSPTGIDLPYESRGLVPNRSYLNKKYTSRGWSTGNLLSFVIGQGDMLSTPLQVIQMINLIATNGKTHRPHLSLNMESEPFNLNLKPFTWQFIQDAMYEVVNGDKGTGKNAKCSGPGRLYGKTGTAENPHGEPHSWFAGFTKLPSSRILSVAVVVENGGKGSVTAALIAKQVFQYYSENF